MYQALSFQNCAQAAATAAISKRDSETEATRQVDLPMHMVKHACRGPRSRQSLGKCVGSCLHITEGPWTVNVNPADAANAQLQLSTMVPQADGAMQTIPVTAVLGYESAAVKTRQLPGPCPVVLHHLHCPRLLMCVFR